MGKRLIIPGADFSVNGTRTGNIVDITLKNGGSNPYVFYFLPTAISEHYQSDPNSLPTIPADGISKSVSSNGVEPINGTYAAIILGRRNGESTKIIDSLSFDYNSIIDPAEMCMGLAAESIDLRGASFPDDVSFCKMFCHASIKEIKMPKIKARSIRNMFYNFNNQFSGIHSDFSFIEKVSIDLDSAFLYLKSASANFDGIDVSEAQNFNGSFYLAQLEEIDLSTWHIDSALYCESMFRECTNLTTLHLDNWNSTSLVLKDYMFKDTPNLTTVFVTNCSSGVKSWLLARLNECNAGGSNNWSETTVSGKAALVKGS